MTKKGPIFFFDRFTGAPGMHGKRYRINVRPVYRSQVQARVSVLATSKHQMQIRDICKSGNTIIHIPDCWNPVLDYMPCS